MRVALPEHAVALAVRLTDVPATFFERPDAVGVFDGHRTVVRATSDLVEVPDGPMTVEGWLCAERLDGRRGFLSKAQESDFGLFVSDGRPSFHAYVGESYRTAAADVPVLETGRWHHVAGVFDGAEVRLYVDGRLVGRAEGAGRWRRNPFPFFVGADPGARGEPESHFAGRIDEVRLSACARYAGEAFEPERRHVPDADTLLLLHLDAGIGPFVPDHSPAARHAEAPHGIRYEPDGE